MHGLTILLFDSVWKYILEECRRLLLYRMALEKILQECVVNDEDIEVDKSFYGTYGKVELHYRGMKKIKLT